MSLKHERATRMIALEALLHAPNWSALTITTDCVRVAQLDRSRRILGCRKDQIRHLIGMRFSLNALALRSPAEPSFPPIQEPPDPPENPDARVRDPDPAEPGEI